MLYDSIRYLSIWGFLKWEIPKMHGLQWKILLKWMVWGTPILWNHHLSVCVCLSIYNIWFVQLKSIKSNQSIYLCDMCDIRDICQKKSHFQIDPFRTPKPTNKILVSKDGLCLKVVTLGGLRCCIRDALRVLWGSSHLVWLVTGTWLDDSPIWLAHRIHVWSMYAAIYGNMNPINIPHSC